MESIPIDDPEYYVSPPICSETGVIPTINFRLMVHRISDIDTKNLTAGVKIGIVMYWTDVRLKGWKRFLLPGNLWGPELYLMNAVTSEPEYEQFVLFSAEEGRLKRIINYDSVVQAPMDLKQFPFDIQEVGAHFVNISHWRTLNQEQYGSSPSAQLYKLAPVERGDEGEIFRKLMDDVFCTEFELLAESFDLEQPSEDSAGFKMSHLRIKFQCARDANFYVLKAFTPLYILTVVSFLTLATDHEEGLSTRLGLAFTMLLAVVALQGAIAEAVPKVDFLTTIDRIGFVAVLYLCAIAVVATIVKSLQSRMPYSSLRAINWLLCFLLFASFSVVCTLIILPAKKDQTKKREDIARVHSGAGGAPRTVRKVTPVNELSNKGDALARSALQTWLHAAGPNESAP